MEGFAVDDDDKSFVIERRGKRAVLCEQQLLKLPTLSGFEKVTELILARNSLSSIAPLALLPNVRILDVSFNRIESVLGSELPPKLQKLDLSHNETLLQVVGLPVSLTLLELANTPKLGYPPRSCLQLTAKKTRVKGLRLSALKRWLVDNTDATRRLAGAKMVLDLSPSVCADPCVDKPMEDRSALHFVAEAREAGEHSSHVEAVSAACFIVADGHLGVFSADYAVQRLPAWLAEAGVFSGGHGVLGEVMARAVTEFDEQLCNTLEQEKRQDGSTLAIAVVTGDGVVTTCWLGDSRVLIGHADGTYTAMSEDHKPDNAEEKARIEALGGKVTNNGTARVEGILAMSRSLGDVRLKRPVAFVSNVPSARTFQLRPNIDTFLLLASDGLWDVCSNTLASRTVASCDTANAACKKLVRIAKLNSTRDNTLCLAVKIDAAAKN